MPPWTDGIFLGTCTCGAELPLPNSLQPVVGNARRGRDCFDKLSSRRSRRTLRGRSVKQAVAMAERGKN
jgi:hypothetical protein